MPTLKVPQSIFREVVLSALMMIFGEPERSINRAEHSEIPQAVVHSSSQTETSRVV
jgi:hypothetical protein